MRARILNNKMNLNHVILVGRLVRDPELKSLSTGTNVSSFSIATSRTWKDKAGQKQEQAEFHNLVAWGRTAEIACQYCKKGSLILIEGRLQTRKWQDKDSGATRYATEIVVEKLQLGPRPQNATTPQGPPPSADPATGGTTTPANADLLEPPESEQEAFPIG